MLVDRYVVMNSVVNRVLEMVIAMVRLSVYELVFGRADDKLPCDWGSVSDAEDGLDGLVFTVGVFLHFVSLEPLLGTTTEIFDELKVEEDPSAIRRRASHCSSWQSPSSPPSVVSGSCQPVAVRTASRSSSLESPPASQMEKPRRPSVLMKEPLAVKARGES